MSENKPGFWQQYKEDFKRDLKEAEEKRLARPTSLADLQEKSAQKQVNEVYRNAATVRSSGGKYLVVDLSVNILGASGSAQAVINDLYAEGWTLFSANASETVVMGSPFTHWHLVFEDSTTPETLT